MSAAIMQGTCRCQISRRIQNQPAEMKIVLNKLSEALIAGRSEIFTIANLHQMKGSGDFSHEEIRVNLCSSVAL